MSNQSNQAAWLKSTEPLVVDKTEYPVPDEDEVVIKTHAVAINPVDWKIQQYGGGGFISLPAILGEDAAGEVVETGSAVKDFTKGDRVILHASALWTQKPKNGAFQNYMAASQRGVSKIPSKIPFTHAVALPLAISTASAGLYQPGHLELPNPNLKPADSGKVIVIYGASSSVGMTALQLSRASGVEVVATASKRNHELLTSLGATSVIDYSSSSAVDDVVAAVKATGKTFAGIYDSISLPESIKADTEIIKKLNVSSKRVITVLPGTEKSFEEGIDAMSVAANTIHSDHEQVGKAVWKDFVPAALESGALKPLPEPHVVGKGLEKIEEGFEVQKKGVSAKKVVVEL